MRILWIDDDWSNDEKDLNVLYNDLQSAIEKIKGNVDIERASDSTAAYKLIDTKNYGLVIVDIEFLDSNKNKQFTQAQELFEKLESKYIHYVIYSNYIHDIKTTGNYCIGLYNKGKDRQLEFVKAIEKYVANSPYRILQVSDLHYSTNNEESDDYFQIFGNYLQEISEIKNIDFVALTGDFAAKNPSEEHSIVSFFLRKIFRVKLKLGYDEIFVVPGNHEVIWSDFSKKERSKKPYSTYVRLLESLYDSNRAVLSSFKGWNKTEIPIDVSEKGLSWHRYIASKNLSIIGICSNATNPEEQGLGVLSTENIKYISDKWVNDKLLDETRILLLHHNLFPVRSNDSRDENRTILNAGKAINILVEHGCDIVLSGHTHRSESILYESTVITKNGYEKGKELLLINSGTCGGVVPTFDFPNMFNVIDISYDIESEKKRIEITPHMYDSRTSKWNSSKSVIFYI